MFKLRIFSVDHYMSRPQTGYDRTYSLFRGKEIKQVPVLRVFGTSESGKKCLLHIHGVFPYFYIPYSGPGDNVDTFCHQLALSLDKAINIAMGQTESSHQHVYQATAIAALPLYGYHNKKHQFIKVEMYNPHLIRKAAQLVQNGGVLNTVFQPYEVHINFELQFMIDYNLHGMNWIELSRVTFRTTGESIRASNENSLKKSSVCALECDCEFGDIENIKSVSSTLKNPGIAEIWEEEAQRRRNQGNMNDFTQDVSQERQVIEEASSAYYMEKLKERLDCLDDPDLTDTFNGSVYPSEVVDPGKFLNASLKVSLNDSLPSQLEDPNDTLIDENKILQATQENSLLNQLYEALMAYDDLSPDSDRVEIDKDSVLSQYVKNEDNDIDDQVNNISRDEQTTAQATDQDQTDSPSHTPFLSSGQLEQIEQIEKAQMEQTIFQLDGFSFSENWTESSAEERQVTARNRVKVSKLRVKDCSVNLVKMDATKMMNRYYQTKEEINKLKPKQLKKTKSSQPKSKRLIKYSKRTKAIMKESCVKKCTVNLVKMKVENEVDVKRIVSNYHFDKRKLQLINMANYIDLNTTIALLDGKTNAQSNKLCSLSTTRQINVNYDFIQECHELDVRNKLKLFNVNFPESLRSEPSHNVTSNSVNDKLLVDIRAQSPTFVIVIDSSDDENLTSNVQNETGLNNMPNSLALHNHISSPKPLQNDNKFIKNNYRSHS